MEERNSSGYHRPRRPASETIAYLRGLPLDIDSAHQEVTQFLSKGDTNYNNSDDDDDFFPQSLAAAFSALEEVKGEIASLAGDEYGSQSIEILTQIAAPHSEIASRILLNACKGYYLHLATHRYGSHVLQTILQLSATYSSSDGQDLALHEEAPPTLRDEDTASLPSLYDCIQEVVEELAPHASELVVHLCGSHVLRTLLCVLGGVSLVAGHASTNKRFEQTGANIRGRLKSKKKKKKKKPTSGGDDPAPHAGTMSIVYPSNPRIDPAEFSSTLESLSSAILGEPSEDPGELQQHACHNSAGPLLIVLVRVLTYASKEARAEFSVGGAENTTNSAIADFRMGIAKPEPRYSRGSLADKAVKQILCWQDGAEEQEHASDVVYGLSGEPRGSHVLETILRLCPDEVYELLLKYGDFLTAQTMQDYVAHPVSNFVVQTMLTTVRNKEQAETVLKTVEKVIASGLAIDPAKKRRGILWRATELAAKYRIEQDGLLKAIRLGFLACKGDSNSAAAEAPAESSEGGKKKKQRKKASSVEIKDCIPILIGLKRNSEDDQRITLDAAGCRSVHHMLRFSPRLCQDVLDGLLKEVSSEDLVSLARDGLGSRCIMDGILDGPVKTPIFATATKDLREKLEGNWASLATDRVGHHTVKKLFKHLPKIDDKAKLVEELYNAGNRLRGNAMGRSIIDACLIDAYDENRTEWRHRVGKLQSTTEEKFLADVTGKAEQKNHQTKSADSSAAAVVVEGEEDAAAPKAKRKRRRKRKTNDDGEINDSSRKAQKLSTESIMNIMNVN